MSFIKNNKILVLAIAILTVVVGIGVSIFLVKPKITLQTVKTEETKLANTETKIGLNTKEQKIVFDKPHKLSLNGKNLGINKEFILKMDDFQEGQNQLQITGADVIGPVTLLSKDTKNFEVVADKTAPELLLDQANPGFVLLNKELSIKIKQEPGTKILVNDVEAKPSAKDPNTIDIPVIDGQNDVRIVSRDDFQNDSKPVNLTFQALVKDGWEKLQCGKFIFPINSNDLQVGFSGFVTPSKTTSQAAQDKLIYSFQHPDCSKIDKMDSPAFIINPKGTKLYCSECEGITAFIVFGREITDYKTRQIDGGDNYTDTWAKYLVKKDTITSKAGVVWEKREFNLPKTSFEFEDPAHTTFDYVTNINGVNYRLTCDSYPGEKGPKAADYLSQIVDNTVVSQ
jgi:hypothetical protein